LKLKSALSRLILAGGIRRGRYALGSHTVKSEREKKSMELGMTTLREAGLRRIYDGDTTINRFSQKKRTRSGKTAE
jgi:hypothetical protein